LSIFPGLIKLEEGIITSDNSSGVRPATSREASSPPKADIPKTINIEKEIQAKKNKYDDIENGLHATAFLEASALGFPRILINHPSQIDLLVTSRASFRTI
jgi:hypothetical protein